MIFLKKCEIDFKQKINFKWANFLKEQNFEMKNMSVKTKTSINELKSSSNMAGKY